MESVAFLSDTASAGLQTQPQPEYQSHMMVKPANQRRKKKKTKTNTHQEDELMQQVAAMHQKGCRQTPKKKKIKMAASLSSARSLKLMNTLSLISSGGSRSLHVTATYCKNRAARVRVGKGDKPVTYEQAWPPHYIAHRKGWLSQHTGNLSGEEGAAERIVEDVFFRRFMTGTFHGCLANEIVIKRRGNMIVICAFMIQKLLPTKFYFLIGYTETLLSYFYKCPVKLEIQTLEDKVVYKYI
ncbi:28S ribosomal protein S24, mitochondrial [Thalassophryne amazonica]|uniref:28S ribosomal protein S24, mitochondrial n=1 Tax=Thalassophryne amazonica TaxID=390379 RepID=UPI0014714CF4|nr:28S ribosomal protein S24, mitochondrial [Thalassophryne amazonica]